VPTESISARGVPVLPDPGRGGCFRGRPTCGAALCLTLACLFLLSCETFGGRRRDYPPPPPPASPSAPGEPLTPAPAPPPPAEPVSPKAAERPALEASEPLPVTPVPEPIVVEAWSEPKHLPPWGGDVQILVRVQKRGGRRYPGVEVRLVTSTGTLFSRGGLLVTDSQGMTRDRLTATEAATITLNAGGTRYRFLVPMAGSAP
jgi:hypothetical protein